MRGLKGKRVKFKFRFFAIVVLLIVGVGSYFALTHFKKREKFPVEKRYSVQLKDVHTLSIQGTPRSNEKITKINDSNSQFNYQYKMAGNVSVQFSAKEKQAISYKIGDNKKHIQFTLKSADLGMWNVRERILKKHVARSTWQVKGGEFSHSSNNIFNTFISRLAAPAYAEAPAVISQSSIPSVSENMMEYPVTIQGIPMTMRLTTSEGKIKEEFIISKKPDSSWFTVHGSQLEIPFDVEMKGLSEHESAGEYFLLDSTNGSYWTILKPTLTDQSGKTGNILGSLNGRVYTLSLSSSFLDTARYPVIVDPTIVINLASTTGSSLTQKKIVATSEGTIHIFAQVGTQSATCAGSSKSGLLWFTSSDAGATWVCQGQIDSDTTNLRRADVRTDSSDNIYLVYSQGNGGWGTSYDIYYRKLTKGVGSTWTIESSQLVLDGTATIGYDNPVLEIEGTSRVWMATRKGQSGAGYTMEVYYSDNLSASPTWTLSTSSLVTLNCCGYGMPTMARFGSKIGLVYSDYPGGGSYAYYYTYRTDGDSLSSWATPQSIANNGLYGGGSLQAVGTSGGLLHVYYNYQTSYYALSYNGSSWSSIYSSGPGPGYGTSGYTISATGLNTWIFDLAAIGGFGVLPWQTKIQYKQGNYPFDSSSYSSSGTNLVSYHRIFDKVWRYFSNSYTDVTTASGNTTTADVSMVTGIGDIMYFGQSEQFDAISWTLSTAGTTGVNAWEYCTAVDGSSACTTWSTLTFLDSSNSNFTNTSGTASFTAPADWVAAKVNGEGTAYYYIRARTSTGFGTPPVGTMFASIPNISGLTAIPGPASNKIYLFWYEGNSAASYRIRSTSISVTPISGSVSSSSTTSLSTLMASSSWGGITRKSVVRTSNGTLHAFLQLGTETVSCSGQNKSGLVWLQSTDGGATWVCQGQLNSDISVVQYMYANARVDSADNMYVIYGKSGGAFGAAYDIYYRKLTYNGSSWTLGAQQTALDSTLSNNGYANADIELEGATRIWISATFYNGSAYVDNAYYSSDFSDSPTWTLSGTVVSTSYPPQLERFGGNKLGYVYQNGTNVSWAYRSDSDGLSTWSAPAVITGTGRDALLSLGTANGLFVASNYQTTYYLTFYNGTSWSTAYTNSDANTYGGGLALATDGVNIWYFEDNRNGIDYNMTSSPIYVYRKGVSPFGSSNFPSKVRLFQKQGFFQKVFRYASSQFYDLTNQASSSTNGDTPMLSSTGDMVYFGKIVKFNAIYFYLNTTGTGAALWEYWNGSDWVILNSLTDLTSYNLNASNAKIVFTPPDDWAPVRVNNDDGLYYYVRVRAISDYSATPIGNQFLSSPNTSITTIPTLNGNRADMILGENNGSTVKFLYQGVNIKPAAKMNRGVKIQRGTTIRGN
ncbi:MAG: sialidase family protein [Candidatus Levyibacteriota bacterium]